MEFGKEKCSMLLMKCGKRHMTEGMELPNQKKLERSEKRKPTNTWEYWKLTSQNKLKLKKKLRKSISGEPENYSRQKYIVETLSKG